MIGFQVCLFKPAVPEGKSKLGYMHTKDQDKDQRRGGKRRAFGRTQFIRIVFLKSFLSIISQHTHTHMHSKVVTTNIIIIIIDVMDQFT